MAGAVRTTPGSVCAAVDRVGCRSGSFCGNVHMRHQLWVRSIRIKKRAVVEEALARGAGRRKAEVARNRRGRIRLRFAIGESDATTSAKATE